MAKEQPDSSIARRPYWIPAVLAAAAVILMLDPAPFSSPVPAATPVPDWATDPTPVREPSLKPQYRVAGFMYRCSDCHNVLPSPPETDRILTQHTEVVLKHGINTRCFNCHHRTNRNAFADDLGHEIPWDQPQLLCGKCHGPVYRDWQHGVHGRTNGYWDPQRGPQSRRKCIECHDPHRPPFPPMHPAPGPHTLRMGPQQFDGHADVDNPLRVTAEPAAAPALDEEH
jgi:hypothetical protein